MIINILQSNDKNGVYLKLTLDGFEPFWFYRAGASQIEVTLLQEKLIDALNEQMRELRRVSYQRGWRQAKSKKAKQDWFATCSQVLNWEKTEAGL